MIADCARGQSAAMVFSLVACLLASLGVHAQEAPDYAALVAAPDRSDADRKADTRRDPVPLLAFTGLRPGMKVLDMGAGGGYSTELIARAVAPGGIVYGQNAADLNEKAKTTFDARLKTSAMKDVVADVRPFDDPVPPGVHDFDLITFLFYYHDTTYMNVDRAEMDRNLFAALKPGGFLVIVDIPPCRARAPRSARRSIASRRARCARKSRRPASASLPKAISGDIPTTRTTSRASGRPCRSMSLCSNSRSRCEADYLS